MVNSERAANDSAGWQVAGGAATPPPSTPREGREPVTELLEILRLETLDETATESRFRGRSQWMPHGRMFGGQVFAQALTAAQATLADARPAHSMHGYFLRPGSIDQPVDFVVERVHDGRSFSTRRTQAYQGGVPILSMIASFQRVDEGFDQQVAMPEGLPAPEDLPTASEVLADINHPAAEYWAHSRPFDIRHCDGPIFTRVDGEHRPSQAVWLRTPRPIGDDPALHRSALAYASDLTILESTLRAQGKPWIAPGLRAASLDHAMWFHRDARVDDWLLYSQRTISASGGRGLNEGLIFTRDGRLVATVMQEGMVRFKSEGDSRSQPSNA